MRTMHLRHRLMIAAAALLLGSCAQNGSGGGGMIVVPEPASLNPWLFASVGGTVTVITAPPADTGRVFVVEQTGEIRIVKHNVLLARPFLDLSGQTLTSGEDGALGLAFAGDYAASGIFYVSYVNTAGDLRIERYHVSAADPDSAVLGSATPVFSLALSTDIHHGGAIHFGPDGKLWMGIGDGGPQNDANHTGQSRNDLFGSILRFNIFSSGLYGTPADNPWFNMAPLRGELWSYGLRNPWGFSFDRTTGDLYIGDVGQDAWEEIDVGPAASGRGKAANYGWSVLEGTHPGPNGPVVTTGKTMPVIEYGHNTTNGECAVVGGVVYRGKLIPGLAGLYLYTDLCAAWIRSFRLSGGVATEQKDWNVTLPDGPSTIGEDANGEVYFGCQGGSVFKLMP